MSGPANLMQPLVLVTTVKGVQVVDLESVPPCRNVDEAQHRRGRSCHSLHSFASSSARARISSFSLLLESRTSTSGGIPVAE